MGITLWSRVVVLTTLMISLSPRTAGGQDCNGNGVPDNCDLTCGGICFIYPNCNQSSDCTSDGIPDECQDCNDNGIVDSCDVTPSSACVINPGHPCNGCGGCGGLPDINGNGLPDDCDPGACCNPDASCLVTSQLLCLAGLNNTYLGGGTSCDPNSCGACYVDSGTCLVASVGLCVSSGGVHQGAGTVCDCNLNGVNDGMDISEGTSQDADGNGVPDECVVAMNACFFGLPFAGCASNNWSDGSNWPLEGNYPDNVLGAPDIAVTICGGCMFLDVTVEIPSLLIQNDGTLLVTQANTGDLVMASPNGIVNDGVLIVGDSRSLIAADSLVLRGPQPITLDGPGASLSSAGPDMTITNELTIQGHGIIAADFINTAAGIVQAGTPAASLVIGGAGNKINNGLFTATGGGTLRIEDDVTGSGAYIATAGGTVEIMADVTEEPVGAGVMIEASGGEVLIGSNDVAATANGCGPVIVEPGSPGIIEVNNSALINFTSWTIGDEQVGPGMTATMNLINGATGIVNGPVAVRQNGTLSISASDLTAVDLTLEAGATLTVGSSVTLGGSVGFDLTDEQQWSWSAGSILMMTGGAGSADDDAEGYVTLEIGGQNVGTDPQNHVGAPAGFSRNFELSELHIGPDAHVSLVDNVDNGNRIDNGFGDAEALYAEVVTFADTEGRLNLNGLHLYYNTLNGMPSQIMDLLAACTADLDGSSQVDATDLALLLGAWGPCPDPCPPACAADLSEDCTVDATDLALLLGDWGGCQ